MWTLIRVITAASCSEIAQDSGQTPEQLLWDLGRSLCSLKGVRRRRIRGSRGIPGPASSGTRRGGRCRPGRSPCAAGTRGGSCARTARSGAGSSLRGGTHPAQPPRTQRRFGLCLQVLYTDNTQPSKRNPKELSFLMDHYGSCREHLLELCCISFVYGIILSQLINQIQMHISYN